MITLRLEVFGPHPCTGLPERALRPWVARIIGTDAVHGFRREFVRGQTSYAEANSVGSRGVRRYYHLGDGVYEINERVAWKRAERYFLQVLGEESRRISREHVLSMIEMIKAAPEVALKAREKLGLLYPTAWKHLDSDAFD